MIVPAAMFIESAIDMLKDNTVPVDVRADQAKELTFATGDHDPQFIAGYELGLQVARVLLMGNMKAVLAGVTI